VVFIPKPGKSMSQAKSLRSISLMSVILKTLQKLLYRHIRVVSWLKNHYIRTKLPIGQVCLQKPLSYSQTTKVPESQGVCVG
jgi:hypothetical protein